jgi:ABC-type spermidine/putrescine transport system permease subunit I
MIPTFIGSALGMLAGNYVYQAFCSNPNWALATERSWFQLIALLAVGAALAIRSINA